MFKTCIAKFKNKNIVISYRYDGFPTIETITDILTQHKTHVRIVGFDYKYALSSKTVKEILLIAWD